MSGDAGPRHLTYEEVERLVAERTAERDALRRQLVVAEEAERRRLARELHDQLGQELTAFRLGLDDVTRLVTRQLPANAPVLARLAQLEALAASMTSEVRSLALELRPPSLDDLGLEHALESYAAEWTARYGLPAEVTLVGSAERPVPPEQSSALYRIAQEALTNVARHARASGVSVILDRSESEVRLIVEDDGRGFDVEEVATRGAADRRLGLGGMRERATLAGGTLTVESGPGVGTTVYVRLPA